MSEKDVKIHEVYVVADNILSPLASNTAENFEALKSGQTAVKIHHDTKLSPAPFAASLFKKDVELLTDGVRYTKFEQLLIASIQDATRNCAEIIPDKNTILIISSTKGNISLLETTVYDEQLKKRVALSTSAQLVADYFGFVNQPVIISNACISGVLGIITGMRLLQSGQYKHAVVVGADVISKFILSGFESFQALSPQECKPFDQHRNGLNLGEAAATLVLSSDRKYTNKIKVRGGGVTNDANHISGPSRTGKELGDAVGQALKTAGLTSREIDFISAHGTATLYNDEMEAKALALNDLQTVPLNSLKGYYGHTLGAAGLIESIISIQSLKENVVIGTKGFESAGVSLPVNVNAQTLDLPVRSFIKTASGFGGCNAAVVFSK